MCIIIMREAGVELDADKFKTLVMNNPNGWGISVPDGEGNLLTFRQVEDEDTDAEALYEYIHDEFKDDKIMLHLRYTTAGDTILRNAHPFPVLEREADGSDVRLAHNGTLTSYVPSANSTNKWESDTRVFTRNFVRPLLKRLALGRSPELILKDEFTKGLLDTQLTSMSVVTLIDGHGNTLLVNEKGNGGFTEDDGTYYSNKYSFDANHRKPYTVGKTSASSTTPKTTGRTTMGTTTGTFTDTNVEMFTTKYDIAMKDDLFLLSDEAIESLVDEEPEDAILLIKELLGRLYQTTGKLDRATRNLQRKSVLIADLEKTTKEGQTNASEAA